MTNAWLPKERANPIRKDAHERSDTAPITWGLMILGGKCLGEIGISDGNKYHWRKSNEFSSGEMVELDSSLTL